MDIKISTPSDTPRTDAIERFMYYEPPFNDPSDYPTKPPRVGRPPLGFVPSEFARELEREIASLKNSRDTKRE